MIYSLIDQTLTWEERVWGGGGGGGGGGGVNIQWTGLGLTLLQGGEVCRQNNKEDYGRWYREKYTLSGSREKCEWW